MEALPTLAPYAHINDSSDGEVRWKEAAVRQVNSAHWQGPVVLNVDGLRCNISLGSRFLNF